MNSSLTLLGLIAAESSYGYDLKALYDRLFGIRKPLAFGQVYGALSRMIRDGYIELAGEEAGGGPDRKKYAVTPDGREHLVNWMFTPDVPSETLQGDLFAKTVIALLVDEDAGQLLDLQRASHLARMRELTHLKREADLMRVLIYDLALFHIEADLRWIDMTAARLSSLNEELHLI
jgi:DNA-binding PadR family transcriptional regulator